LRKVEWPCVLAESIDPSIHPWVVGIFIRLAGMVTVVYTVMETDQQL
jgi:hypothetical protein